MSGTIKIGGVEVPLDSVCIPTSKPRRGSFEALAAVLREGPPPPPDEPDWDPFDIEPLTLSGDSTGVETTATQAPVTLTDEQFKEGCAGPDLAKRMYDMTAKAIQREAVTPDIFTHYAPGCAGKIGPQKAACGVVVAGWFADPALVGNGCAACRSAALEAILARRGTS